MAKTRRGMLDTSVVVDLGLIPAADLPEEASVSAITMAELSAGTHATDDHHERARRQDRLQLLESWIEPVPFDADCARAYGRIYAAASAVGRQPRRRVADLLIAATAMASDMSLYTRNSADFHGLEDVLDIVTI